jgi:UDPglucose 6-dehydrogenase
VIQVNENRKRAMALRILDACGGTVRGKTIAVLGLAFKSDTDDMRDSPAIPVIQALQDFGATVRAYDPEAMENAKKIFTNVTFCEDAMEAASGADAVALLTEWTEFKELNLNQLRARVAAPLLVDLRNMLAEDAAVDAGFHYWCIGRKNGAPTVHQAIAAE